MRLEDIHSSLVGMAPYPPSPTRWNDIASFTDSYTELAAASRAEDVSQQASRIAYQLLKIAGSSHSTALIRIILNFWLLLGPIGRIVCVRFLGMKVIPSNVLMELVSALRLKDQLHLLNELLLAGAPPDPYITTWAKGVLHPNEGQTDYDHEQVIILCADLAQCRRELAPAVADYLYRHDFAPWLAGLLSHPLDESDIIRAAKAAPLVHNSRIVELLCEYIDGEQGAVQDAAAEALEDMPRFKLPGKEIKRLLQVFPQAEPQVRPRIMGMALGARTPNQDKIAAYFCRSAPEASSTLAEVLPTLPPDRTARCLPLLSPDARGKILGAMFQHICAADHDFARQYEPQEPLDDSIRNEFKAYLHETEAAMKKEISAEAAPEKKHFDATVPRTAQLRANAQREHIEAQVKYLPEDHDIVRSLMSGREVKGDLNGTGIRDVGLRDRSMKWTSWKNAHLSGISFENMTLHDVDMSGCLIENVIFHNCQLQKTDFTGTVFVNCLFQWSNIRNSSLADSIMLDCRINGMSFQACDMINVAWNGMDVATTRFLECSLWGAAITDAEMTCLRIMATDFSHTRLDSSAIRGCEFSQCLFDQTQMISSEGTNCRHTASLFSNCRFQGFWSDTPAAIIGMHQSTLAALRNPMPKKALGKWAYTAAATSAIRAFVDSWLHRVDILARRALFAKEDKRRLCMGLETLGTNKASALKLLPLLLENDLLEHRMQSSKKLPICRVLAYSPDYITWDLAQKHFDAFELDPPPTDALVVSGIYTVGAFGSLAQLSSSPTDLLICCRCAPDNENELLQGLREKLNLFREWIWEEFTLDITFHLLPETLARKNNFGSAPHETAPTAQAALLKDEIYATAIRLFGNELLWRVIPPQATPERYTAATGEIARLWPQLLDHSLDLGPLPRLSPEKYVKALLWTAIKTFDRPYKAIRALVRLLHCVERNVPPSYISDRYKQEVYARTERPDPFTIAFEKAREPYLDSNKKDLLDLLNILFVLKTLCDQEFELLNRPSQVVRKQDARKVLEGWGAKPNTICHQASHDFNFLSALGKRLSMFMVGAFETARNSFWKRFGLTPQESPELERLGRKLTSSFRPGKNKVERLALVRPMSSLFSEVELYAEKTPGRPTVWIAKGNLAAGSDRREDMVDVCRDESLHPLFAWLLANGFYTPKIVMDADHSMNPISPRDVRELARGLQEFFPKHETFDMDFITLPEKVIVTRAMFILNLVTARDINRVFEAGVVYSTNMGEMYCTHSQVYDQSIKDHPLHYLKKVAAHTCTAETKLGFFIPGKSRCPRPNIPQYPLRNE